MKQDLIMFNAEYVEEEGEEELRRELKLGLKNYKNLPDFRITLYSCSFKD